MSQRLSADPIIKRPGETLLVGVDFSRYGLAPTAVLIDPPTVDDAGLSAGTASVNAATFTSRRGVAVGVGRGVQFLLSGGVGGQDYLMIVACTDSTGQRLEGECPVWVRE